jgi:hypothetical protein
MCDVGVAARGERGGDLAEAANEAEGLGFSIGGGVAIAIVVV